MNELSKKQQDNMEQIFMNKNFKFFFNATKLCVNGGKEFRKWLRLDRAKELILFFAQNDDKSR
jgi:hypothetical protein